MAYKRGLRSAKDAPERIGQVWLQFERLNADLREYETTEEAVSQRMTAIVSQRQRAEMKQQAKGKKKGRERETSKRKSKRDTLEGESKEAPQDRTPKRKRQSMEPQTGIGEDAEKEQSDSRNDGKEQEDPEQPQRKKPKQVTPFESSWYERNPEIPYVFD